MKINFINQLQRYPRAYITDIEMAMLLGGTPNGRYSKVKRLIAQGYLVHVKRGLYVIAAMLRDKPQFHPFELAQHIYAPSSISLESALAYHQLIPEAVYMVSSITQRRNKEFTTPVGNFSYQHVPAKNFYVQAKLIKSEQQHFIIAEPWRAIFDYVYCYKKTWDSLEPLAASLRIDLELLPRLSLAVFDELILYYDNKRLTKFIRIVREKYV